MPLSVHPEVLLYLRFFRILLLFLYSQYEHHQDLRRNHWIVDETAIEKAYDTGEAPEITDTMVRELEQTYRGI